MRLSELTALKLVDISLDLGWLFVGKSKSAAGRRRLALDADTVDVLRDHLSDQAERRDVLGPNWQEHGVVFDRGDGRPVAPRTVEATMTSRDRRLGLPKLTPHRLRHTHATTLLAGGIPVHAVQQRLGHESAQITLDVYAHVLPGDDRTAPQRFAGLVSGGCLQVVSKTPQPASFSAS